MLFLIKQMLKEDCFGDFWLFCKCLWENTTVKLNVNYELTINLTRIWISRSKKILEKYYDIDIKFKNALLKSCKSTRPSFPMAMSLKNDLTSSSLNCLSKRLFNLSNNFSPSSTFTFPFLSVSTDLNKYSIKVSIDSESTEALDCPEGETTGLD
ncbi:hypothetical protein BpHYR1_052774 [Brachionus plicatilis]|uniref:Uncharacterized protein n=1 Tax=Brachionus plicatilis TaxID=10195 RepID=A0A3M7T100_BRAPC|nr:hypothetical protein BpHYR1_052774 [Brachionus plicatilis]